MHLKDAPQQERELYGYEKNGELFIARQALRSTQEPRIRSSSITIAGTNWKSFPRRLADRATPREVDCRRSGSRVLIRLIEDGDPSAGIAAALRCLNAEIQGRLVIKDEQQAERMKSMRITLRTVVSAQWLDLSRHDALYSDFPSCGLTLSS